MWSAAPRLINVILILGWKHAWIAHKRSEQIANDALRFAGHPQDKDNVDKGSCA